MTGTPRERARAQTMQDIIRIGREHLATHGAAALSLRAVARDLGVVSSAVYRYVSSRDELLTLLVVDGYNDLGDAVDAALEREPQTDYRARFRAIGWAVRDWGVREPARYGLLFGSPVPGYEAPTEQTTGPGTRVIVALIQLYDAAYQAGAVSIPASIAVPEKLGSDFDAIRSEFDIATPDNLIARGVLVWAALFGAINFDLFDQYGPGTFTDRGALFGFHLEVLLETVGFV